MPSLEITRLMLGGCTTAGEVHKMDGDLIMEATWDNDIATRNMYFYDYQHDNYQTKLNNLNSVRDNNKKMMRCKFLQSSKQTYSKDAVTFHLQMRPSQKCVVPYYNGKQYNAEYPCGLYVDIPNYNGEYERWLVVGNANNNVTQFPTYELLRCDYVVDIIIDNVKYHIPSVLRSQNS